MTPKLEWIDSVAYGSPLISYTQTQILLNQAIYTYANQTNEGKDLISMLLIRFNETLNLPYSYERIESYWRILESIGKKIASSRKILDEYERLKKLIGIKNQSHTLKIFISTLVKYDLDYKDSEIIESFNYRNKLTHEYLNSSVINEPQISEIFTFLKKTTELLILHELNIDKTFYLNPGLTLLCNRVC